jgi:hypothetical protein
MDIRVETLPNYRIAYVRQIGPYGPANLQVMQELKRWAMEKNYLLNRLFYSEFHTTTHKQHFLRNVDMMHVLSLQKMTKKLMI